MPNLNKRDEVEARLARIVAKGNRQALAKITETLGDPPHIDRLNSQVWDDIKKNYDQALLPEFEKIFHDAAEAMIEHVGVGVEWDLINTRAANYARTATLDLVTKLTDNSRTVVQNAVTDFYNQRLDLGGLQDRLARTFGPIRAESIAITETTRAAAQGERAYAEELRAMGAEIRGVIHNEGDDRVCPICSPLEGKDPDVEGYPPFHPFCRCNVGYTAVLPETASKAVFYLRAK